MKRLDHSNIRNESTLVMEPHRTVKPRTVRIDASTICQLDCRTCPNAAGEIQKNIGAGFLLFEDFKKVIEDNAWIEDIELSNWGEIFLNPDLLKIIKYAHLKNVLLRADNGVNLNTVNDEVLEALVSNKFKSMTCSIDGTTQETYSIYRKNGNLAKVLEHIGRINHYKKLYKSHFPILTWQFVAFDHNTRQIGHARKMAKELGMKFSLKLSWEDLYVPTFSPVNDKDTLRKASGLGVASRAEFLEKTGKDYIEGVCLSLWEQPQINFDGRVLGCPVNYIGDYGNIFKDGLIECLNNEKINYARQMLLGYKEARSNIPCTACKIYESRKKRSAWVRNVMGEYHSKNKFFGHNVPELFSKLLPAAKRRMRKEYLWEGLRDDFDRLFPKSIGARSKSSLFLPSHVYSLQIPLPIAEKAGWKPYHLFNGITAGIRNLSCHASVLNYDHSPHPPHAHEEEEILLLLWGEVDLILPDIQGSNVTQRIHMKPGEFVYYPAYFAHTLQATKEISANYLMFKWRSDPTENKSPLSHMHCNIFGSTNDSQIKAGFNPRLLFEGPTTYLQKLHSHTSTVTSGAGYDPHIDHYDLAIVVLEGEVETLGKRVGPHAVIFYHSGEPHGIKNPGESLAKYVVFEFHGRYGKK